VEHGLDVAAIAVVAGCFVVWGIVSARFERGNLTAPIAFVVVGLVLANGRSEPMPRLRCGCSASSSR
jgi:hypothetical protein